MTSYTVIYRKGGYLNATWHKTTPVHSHEDAIKRSNGIKQMGHRSIIHPTDKLNSIGMPVGYCGNCDPTTGECQKTGAECSKLT